MQYFENTAEQSASQQNEITVDRDIMVLTNPEIAKLPN